jgi:hypothetical protein
MMRAMTTETATSAHDTFRRCADEPGRVLALGLAQ